MLRWYKVQMNAKEMSGYIDSIKDDDNKDDNTTYNQQKRKSGIKNKVTKFKLALP